jgi:hypothetical protein
MSCCRRAKRKRTASGRRSPSNESGKRKNLRWPAPHRRPVGEIKQEPALPFPRRGGMRQNVYHRLRYAGGNLTDRIGTFRAWCACCSGWARPRVRSTPFWIRQALLDIRASWSHSGASHAPVQRGQGRPVKAPEPWQSFRRTSSLRILRFLGDRSVNAEFRRETGFQQHPRAVGGGRGLPRTKRRSKESQLSR